MSRISHSTPLKAFDHVAKLMKDAAGSDGILSRSDATRLVKELKNEGRGTEALAAENLFKMLDKRDERVAGARITGADLSAVKAFVKDKLLENRDVSHDGYSKTEIARMSATGRALVEIGRMLEAGVVGPQDVLNAGELKKALVSTMKDVLYTSESDYPFEGVQLAGKGDALKANGTADFLRAIGRTGEFTEEWSASDFFTGHRGAIDGDAEATYDKLKTLVDRNLTNVRIIRVCENENMMPQVSIYVVGRHRSGDLVGLKTTSVET